MTNEFDLSDEVSETAKAAQDVDKALGSPMALLLGPTFKLIGDHWGKKTEAYLNPKQVENLEDKIAIAQEHGPLLLGNDIKPRQIAALMEWTDAAHDVDGAEQPLLSRAWGKALKDISEKSYTLLDSLTKLNEADIVLLKNGGLLSKEQLAKFTRIGLIEEAVTHSPVSLAFRVLSGVTFTMLAIFLGLISFPALTGYLFAWPFVELSGSAKQSAPYLFLGFLLPTLVFVTDMLREFVKKTSFAKVSVLGREVISKLDSSEKQKFSYCKKDRR